MMAQRCDTASLVSDYVDEKAALRHFWADMLSESDLLLHEKIEVKPLRNADLKTTVHTLAQSTVHDPLFAYLRDAPDVRHPKRYMRAMKLRFALSARIWVRRRIGFTVDNGHAVVCAVPPSANSRPGSKLDRYVATVLAAIIGLVGRASESKEQRKRAAEVKTKLEGVIKDILGDAEREMRSVSSLATDPGFQRRGYGGALVDFITSWADAEGRATYLLSSNPVNTEFYNSHGFVEIGKALIGEGNPTYDGPPIPILLMVRPLESKLSL